MRCICVTAFLAAMTLALNGAPAPTPASTEKTAPTITREQMVKFVEEAAAYVKEVGREAALREFSNPKGKFVRANGELYLYAYDFKCVCRAHGFTPDLVGKDLTGKKDDHGHLVIQQLRDAAKTGKGFVEYGWTDPVTGKEGRKLGYVIKIDDTLFLGSGIYL